MMKAVVPVKANSSRVPQKNFRPFYGSASLFDILIAKLRDVPEIEEIVVSADDASVVGPLPRKARVMQRPAEWCRPGISFARDIFPSFASQVADPDEPVMLVRCVDPLFDEFAEFVDAFKNLCVFDRPSMTVGYAVGGYPCARNAEGLLSPMEPVGGFPNGFRYEFGPRHVATEKLPAIHHIGPTASIALADDIQEWGYEFGPHCEVFVASSIPSDINTPRDWDLAQRLFIRRHAM